GLTPGSHEFVLEWDTRQGGRNALDYLTHYQRLIPHNQFGPHRLAETVRPLDGITASISSSNVFLIPTPGTKGTMAAGQPAASFLSHPSEERQFTIWNGRITNAVYVLEDPLDGDAAASRLAIEFIAEDSTVVIAWGGHVASKLDWGSGNSATAIDGSPYH